MIAVTAIWMFFIGGRSVRKYGNTPESFLLHNNKGVFENVTQSTAPGLLNMGMVTDATWLDADNDGLTVWRLWVSGCR